MSRRQKEKPYGPGDLPHNWVVTHSNCGMLLQIMLIYTDSIGTTEDLATATQKRSGPQRSEIVFQHKGGKGWECFFFFGRNREEARGTLIKK